jgi:hypothetical protein
MTETALAIGHVLGSPLLATRCHQNQNGYRAMFEGRLPPQSLAGCLFTQTKGPRPKATGQQLMAGLSLVSKCR